MNMRACIAASLLFVACASEPSAIDAAADDASAPIDAARTSDAGTDALVLDAAPDASSAPPARLHASGSDIVDEAGNRVILRGYSWGAWGTAIERDGADNAAQGANVVRLPLRWWGQYHGDVDSYIDDPSQHYVDPHHLQMLDDTIRWATDAGLWVVLFLDSDCGQDASSDVAYCNGNNFWNDSTMRAHFADLWRLLVTTYRDHPLIAAYELLPEPQWTGSHADIRAFYEEMTAVVRELDTRTPVIMGPADAYNAHWLEDAYTTVDDNIIYTVDDFLFTSPAPGHLADMMAFSSAHHVPVWVNQIGIESGRDMASTYAGQALDALNAAHIGWAWWTYRIDSMDPSVHGMYYLAVDGRTWVPKSDWLTLVGTKLVASP